MARPDTLYAVTLDAAPFALVKAIDETDAVDLAFGLLAADWFSLQAANDHVATPPLLAAAPYRRRLAARVPTEPERHHFTRRAQALPGIALAAFLVED